MYIRGLEKLKYEKWSVSEDPNSTKTRKRLLLQKTYNIQYTKNLNYWEREEERRKKKEDDNDNDNEPWWK